VLPTQYGTSLSGLAISHALLFAVNGTATAAAAATVALAGAAEGGEALGRTRDLLLETRASVFANNGWSYDATFRGASTRTSIPGSVSSSYDAIPKPASESGYAEASTGPKEPTWTTCSSTTFVVVVVFGVVDSIGVGCGSGCEGG